MNSTSIKAIDYMVHQKDKPTKESTKMDALFDKVIRAIKEIGINSVMLLATCYFIWVLNAQNQKNTETILSTISKNTEAFISLSGKIDKLVK